MNTNHSGQNHLPHIYSSPNCSPQYPRLRGCGTVGAASFTGGATAVPRTGALRTGDPPADDRGCCFCWAASRRRATGVAWAWWPMAPSAMSIGCGKWVFRRSPWAQAFTTVVTARGWLTWGCPSKWAGWFSPRETSLWPTRTGWWWCPGVWKPRCSGGHGKKFTRKTRFATPSPRECWRPRRSRNSGCCEGAWLVECQLRFCVFNLGE